MESEMDLEDLSELSELSELEEGEIHDDVEIISEYIPNPPKKPCTSFPRKNISCSKKVIPRPKSAYTPSSHEKTDSRANRTNRTNQRDSSQHRVRSQPPHSGQSSKKTVSENNTSKSRSRTSSSLPSTREKSIVKQQTKSDASSGNNKEAEARPLTDSKLGEKNRKIAVCSVPIPEEKPQESPKPNGDSVSETKWKNTFENVGSVDSDMSISSEDEEDEVMMLRLVALHSLDSNVKPKVPDTEATSAISTPTLDPSLNPVNEDEDEDEELLRAQLLIEVARKQTMESESLQQIPEPKTSDSATAARTESKPEVENRHTAPPLKNPLLAIPKADRLVIDLRNDSDSSSDEGETAVEDSITALLKSARQTVEKKADIAQSIPQALSHLPRHQQEEYQRLKQEILRREQNRLLQSQHASSKPATPTGQTEESNSDVATSTPAASTTSNAAPRVIVANIPQQPAASKMAVAPVPSTLQPEEVAKENTKTITRPGALSTAPSRLAVLKQQLVRKRREFSATKEALQKQLELVDRNRSLWMKSSQEVTRLKTMLQQAEETEKQLREQFTNSQQQTQRLKTRMQSVERNIMLLQNGLGINRKRTSSLKSRNLAPKASPMKALPTSPFPFVSPSTTFKVKPRIIAKALAKNVFNSKMTYVKPSDVSQFTASPMTMPAAGKNLVRLTVKQSNSRSRQKKTLTDEQWLFGTLGDKWDDTNTDARPSLLPRWPCNSRASRSTSNEIRLDPSRIVCNFNLDSVCQDANCTFQHLPPASSAPALWTGKAINGGTASTSASQVARASAPSAVVGVSGVLRPTLK